uniref:Uncharacterized protein n=1 Tax=Rhizophora mucronata TaxID=61149 RepID=A0A2P2Q1S6_RHIMU
MWQKLFPRSIEVENPLLKIHP